MMLLHAILATNTRVVFNLCSLLITTLNYHASNRYLIIYLAPNNSTSPCSSEKGEI